MKTRTVILVSVAAVVLAGGSAAVGAALAGGDDSPTVTATSSPAPTSETTTTVPSQSSTPVETTTTTSTTPPRVTPTTTTPPSTPAVLHGAVTKEVFPGLTAPIPSEWAGQSSDGDSHTYADMSSCTTKAKVCPQVQFLSLTSGSNRVNYGANPVRQWAKNVCPSRSPDSVTPMGTFAVDGNTVTAYEFACQGVENYAWHVPGKLLVTAGDAAGGVAVPSTVQAVLEYSRIG